MSFQTQTAWSRPRSKRPRTSTKWTDLQPRDRTRKTKLGPGRKTEFWIFVNHVLETFFARIELRRTCEIQSDFCDGYHIAKAHTRRRTVIPVTDWYHAFRVCWACQECHAWADQRERDESEEIIEKVITDRFAQLGLTDARVKELLIEYAADVQQTNAPRFSEFLVVFD